MPRVFALEVGQRGRHARVAAAGAHKTPLAGTGNAQVALEKALDISALAEHHQLTN
jgi:hypothetical protein